MVRVELSVTPVGALKVCEGGAARQKRKHLR